MKKILYLLISIIIFLLSGLLSKTLAYYPDFRLTSLNLNTGSFTIDPDSLPTGPIYTCQFVQLKNLDTQNTYNLNVNSCMTADIQSTTLFTPTIIPEGNYMLVFTSGNDPTPGPLLSQAFVLLTGIKTDDLPSPITPFNLISLNLNTGTFTIDPTSLDDEIGYACQVVKLKSADINHSYGLNVTDCLIAHQQTTTTFIPKIIPDGNYELIFPHAPLPLVSQMMHISEGIGTAGVVLNVPLLKQNDPAWGSMEYDTTSLWNPANPSISAWGCALTSAAMVFKYYGYEKLPDGSALNPGTLNNWLKANNGYTRIGEVNWIALSTLSRLAKNKNEIEDFNALKMEIKKGNNHEILTENLNNELPTILNVPGHFIVAKGISGNTFSINDPLYNRSSLNEYGNSFDSMRVFKPSNTDLSYIMLVVDENINISFKNSNNEEEGESFIQEPLDNDQGDGTSGQPVNMFYFPEPDNSTYNLELSSSSDQNYQLDVYFYDNEGDVKMATLSGFLLSNSNDEFGVDFSKIESEDSEINPKNKFKFDLGSFFSSDEIKNKGIYNSLVSKLNNYEKAKDDKTKSNILNAFMNELEAQKGNGVSESAYDIIINNINLLTGD